MKKMSLRKRFKVTTRGFGILKQYCPGLVQGKFLYEFINSLQPFVSVWFSAQIINEISGQRKIDLLVLYVSVVVLFNFVCAIFKSILKRICDEKESQMWSWFGKIFSDKQMSLDFACLEDAKIQHQKKQAEENLYMFGNGLAQLVWGTQTLVKALVNITASVAMTADLFTSRSGNAAADNPAWVFILFLCVLIGGLFNSKAVVKENDIFMEWCENTVWFNRAFTFFGQELYMNSDRAKDVRIYRQDKIAANMFDKLIQKEKSDGISIFKMSVYPAIACFLTGIANTVCYLFVVVKAFLGAFAAGDIVQYVAVLSKLGDGLQDLMFMLPDNEVYCIHLQSLFDYLDIPNNKYQGTIPVEKRSFCEGGDNEYEIEFCNVSFRYPGTNNDILKNISVKIQIGQRLSITGINGSGKTTFIKLLCRLYDPSEGEILLNGVDIKKYNYEEYMSIISVVFQDFKLFSFSIAQNVAADVNYNPVYVTECLAKSGFSKRLSQMPDGIGTYLYKDFEQNGVEISGGEAQKIALARAIYKNAPFIILDEPASSLDAIAEAGIYSQFDQITGGRTAIYISHRLSSCKFCDKILVFHEGRIIQNGTHNELVSATGGKYRELWDAQAQYYI